MKQEQMEHLKQLVFDLYGKAAELMSVFSQEEIEHAKFEEELKKIP